MEATLDRLNEVFREVFDDDSLQVSPETTAEDVDGWDSLMHVTLLINVEKAFGVRFSTLEIAELKDVGDLQALVERKRQAG